MWSHNFKHYFCRDYMLEINVIENRFTCLFFKDVKQR